METATQYEQLTADNPNNPFVGDSKLSIRFENRPTKDDARSAEEGRPIFKDVVYIEIRTPGDRDNILHRPMTDLDRKRFAVRFEAWEKTQTEEAVDGTPLSEWPTIPKKTIEELRYFGVYSVEQLAELSDTHVKKGKEIFTWRQKAKDYLEVATKGAAASKLAAANDALERRLAAQDQAIQEQAAIIRELQAKNGR